MYRQEDPEVNIEQIIARIKGLFGGSSGGGNKGSSKAPILILGIILLGVIGWFATGFFSVQPGEEAALRMFGKYSDTRGTGLQWWWPGPIGAKEIIRVDEIRRLEHGVRAGTPVLAESLMITAISGRCFINISSSKFPSEGGSGSLLTPSLLTPESI